MTAVECNRRLLPPETGQCLPARHRPVFVGRCRDQPIYLLYMDLLFCTALTQNGLSGLRYLRASSI
jgi:hypothetical protein